VKNDRELPVISQMHCSFSMGYDAVLEGVRDECRKLRLTPRFTEASAEDLPSLPCTKETVLLLGYTDEWIRTALRSLRARDNTVVLMGAVPPVSGENIHSVSIDHRQIIEQSIAYLRSLGRTKTAFLGCNRISLSSLKMEEVFLQYYNAENMYENYGSTDELCRRFLRDHARFDSVICFIDKIALVLLREAAAAGIHIPDELYVMGIGGTKISALSAPPLTTVSCGYYQCGCTAVSFVRTAAELSEPIHITLRGELSVRTSTADRPFTDRESVLRPGNHENVVGITQDINLVDIGRLEKLFAACDTVDLQILRKMTENKTREQISEEIPIGIATIRYRLNKCLRQAGIQDTRELLELMKRYRLQL